MKLTPRILVALVLRVIFPSCVIFLLPKELPLTLFIVQFYWQWILSLFVCLRKVLFHLQFKKKCFC